MPTQTLAPLRWATSSHADASRGEPIERDALGAHFGRCAGSRGRWFSLQCIGETVHGFVAPRMVTTLMIAVLVLAAGAAVFG